MCSGGLINLAFVFQAAEYLELADLGFYLRNIINKEQYLNKQREEAFLLVWMQIFSESNSIFYEETLSKTNGIKLELTQITF